MDSSTPYSLQQRLQTFMIITISLTSHKQFGRILIKNEKKKLQ